MAIIDSIPWVIRGPGLQKTLTWKANIETTASNIDFNSADVMDFCLESSITNRSGGGTMKIINTDSDFSDIMQINKEWKFYFPDPDTYAMGGYINNYNDANNMFVFELVGYSDLLNRETVNDKSYEDEKPTDIIEDLLDTYYASGGDQVYISYAHHVEAAAGQAVMSIDLDNMTVYEAISKVASQARRTAGTTPFDFWIDYDPTNDAIEIWFNQKNVTASGKSLYRGSDFGFDYAVKKGRADRVVNYWDVRGTTTLNTPTDLDRWTEASLSTYSSMWRDFREVSVSRSAVDYIGSYSISLDCNNGNSGYLGHGELDLDDSDAYDCLTGDKYNMTSGRGYLLKPTSGGYGVNQTLTFYIKKSGDDDDNLDYVSVNARAEDGDGTREYRMYPTDEWTVTKLNLEDFKLPTDGTANYMDGIRFEVYSNGLTSDDFNIYIDGLYFSDLDIEASATDSDATSLSTYSKRARRFTDRNIPTVAGCTAKAAELLAKTKDPIIDVTLPMRIGTAGVNIGETFSLYIPEKEIDGDEYRCTGKKYTKSGLTLFAKNAAAYADEPYTLGSTISSQQSEINEVKRR